MRIAKTLSLIFLLCSPAWSQSQEDWQKAVVEIKQECEDRINSIQATTDSLVGAVKAQQITITKANVLIKDLTKYEMDCKGLVGKYDELVVLSDSTKTLLEQNVELHQATAEEWEKLAVYLKDEYTKLVKKYSRRLWCRWELYAGLMVGIVFGTLLP